MPNNMSFKDWGKPSPAGSIRLATLIEYIEQRKVVPIGSTAASPAAVLTCDTKVLKDMKDCVSGSLDFDDPVGSKDSFTKRYNLKGNAGKILTALKLSGNETKEIKIPTTALVKTAELGSSGGSGSGAKAVSYTHLTLPTILRV